MAKVISILRRTIVVLVHPAALIVIIGIFYLATIRPGQRWGDDFSMYIQHAKNIVLGVDYQDSGYLYDSFISVIGPRYYPPVFPLTLAPVYAFFGLALTPMKVEVILFFLLFLIVFYFSFRQLLTPGLMSAALVSIGFNPSIWNIKEDVMSDLPFLFYVYLTLFLIHQAYQRRDSRQRFYLHAVLVGVFIYLSYGTRNIGIVLIPALLLFDLLHSRRPTFFPWAASAVFFVGWYIQSRVIPDTSSYTDQFSFLLQASLYNLRNYFDAFLSMWSNGYSQIFQVFLFSLLFALAIFGILKRLTVGISIYDVFMVFYILLILLWRANQGIRFLLPVIPYFVFNVFFAIQFFGKSDSKKIRKSGFVVFWISFLLIVFSYIAVYSKVDFGPIREGVEKAESRQLFEYIDQHIRSDAVLLFTKPRALALYTGHKVTGYSTLENEQFTLGFAQAKGVEYMVVGPGDDYLRLLIKRYPDLFAQVYSNSDFDMYQFLAH